jgi:hypothetical protein
VHVLISTAPLHTTRELEYLKDGQTCSGPLHGFDIGYDNKISEKVGNIREELQGAAHTVMGAGAHSWKVEIRSGFLRLENEVSRLEAAIST